MAWFHAAVVSQVAAVALRKHRKWCSTAGYLHHGRVKSLLKVLAKAASISN
jgi:hypothetical protein